jgi:HTH-type transcriptional regulator/antitoxin HigA
MHLEHPIAPAIDAVRYSRLIAEVAPKVIKTEGENAAALAIAEKLMAKGEDGRTPEEDAALELLTMLIGQFEEEAYPAPDGDPVGALRFLMENNDLKPGDLIDEIGSRARVSEILSGKRSISKEQAKRLGDRFKLSPAVFI